MNLDLIIKPRARQDVQEHAAYLDDQSANAGDRFLAELEHVLGRLATFPALGRPWPSLSPAHRDVRRAVLPKLPFSIFYRPTKTAIEVVRVLHHAQDVPPLLDEQ